MRTRWCRLQNPSTSRADGTPSHTDMNSSNIYALGVSVAELGQRVQRVQDTLDRLERRQLKDPLWQQDLEAPWHNPAQNQRQQAAQEMHNLSEVMSEDPKKPKSHWSEVLNVLGGLCYRLLVAITVLAGLIWLVSTI